MWSDNERNNGMEKENVGYPSFAVLPYLSKIVIHMPVHTVYSN